MIENEISIASNGDSLSGTLCLPDPDGSFPVVLMIHGSGPLDRNENIKGQKLDVFNTIADALANAGIASVRYDKRGCGESSGDYYSSTQLAFVNDAINWVDALHRKDFCRASKVYLLGHSEGAVIAPRVHADNPAVAGLVLLCPFVAGLEETLLKQARQIDKEIASFRGLSGVVHKTLCAIFGSCISQQKKLIHKIKATSTDTIKVKFQKIPAAWFRELFNLDLQAIYRRISCPVLLIGGEKDLQCDPNDVSVIEELCNGSVESHVVPNLTHVLRLDKDEPAITKSSKLLDKPVENVVLETIVDWIRRRETLTS